MYRIMRTAFFSNSDCSGLMVYAERSNEQGDLFDGIISVREFVNKDE